MSLTIDRDVWERASKLRSVGVLNVSRLVNDYLARFLEAYERGQHVKLIKELYKVFEKFNLGGE